LYLQIRDLIVPDVETAPVIDMNTASFEPFSAAIGSTVEEGKSISVSADQEPSESDTMTNHSILTAPIGSVIDQEQQTVSVEEPSIRIYVEPVSLVDEERPTTSITREVEEKLSDLGESVAVEGAETVEPDLAVTDETAYEIGVDHLPTVAQLVQEEETFSRTSQPVSCYPNLNMEMVANDVPEEEHMTLISKV